MAIEGNRTNSGSLDEAVEHLKEAEVRLEHACEDDAKAEREVKEAIHEIEEASLRDEVDVHVIHVNELEKASFKEKDPCDASAGVGQVLQGAEARTEAEGRFSDGRRSAEVTGGAPAAHA